MKECIQAIDDAGAPPIQPLMTTGISHLAQELIDNIIDNFFDTYTDGLTNESKCQLRACTLISRPFRERSQKHLFAFLDIYMVDVEIFG